MVNSTGLCGENLNEDRHYRVVITAFSCIRQVELGTTDWVFDFKSWSMTRVWNHLSQEPVNSLSSVDITPACCKMSFLWNKKKSWSVRSLLILCKDKHWSWSEWLFSHREQKNIYIGYMGIWLCVYLIRMPTIPSV